MNAVPRRVELTGEYPVTIRSALHAGKGKLLNLSPGGAYVATPMSLLPQAQVHLRIVIPEERRWVETEAVVVWENRGESRRKDLPPGYGLRFIKVAAETARALRQMVGEPSPPTRDRPAGGRTIQFRRATAGSLARVEEELTVSAFLAQREKEGPPYRLSPAVIREQAPGEPGVFVLSYDRAQEAMVGRADSSLRETLLDFVGRYEYFYAETIAGAEERFRRECELFHRLGGDRGQLDNLDHPAPPPGTDLTCPKCSR